MTDQTEVRIVNPTTGGEKGQKDDRFDLIPAEPLRKVARHYGIGARKYADNNWRKGYAWSLSLGALERHLNAFKQREDIDEETQSPHMAAVAFHALALLEFAETHPELDDRYQQRRPYADLVTEQLVERFNGTLVHTWGNESIFAVDPTEPAPKPRYRVGQELRSKEDFDALPTGTVIVYRNPDSLNPTCIVNRREKGSDGDWVPRFVGLNAAVMTGEALRKIGWSVESLPTYNAGDRIRFGDAVRALRKTALELDAPVYRGKDKFTELEVDKDAAKAFLDALEDAGYQVTKA